MEDIFNSANILNESEVEALFGEQSQTEEENSQENNNKSQGEEEEESFIEIDFDNDPTEGDEGQSESVDEEEDIDNQEAKKQPSSKKGGGASPNLFSSIAKALKEEGVFPDLSDEIVQKIVKAEDFAEAVKDQIKAGLTERQKKIDEALSIGVQPSAVQQYTNVIDYLDKIDESQLSEENEKAEALRKNLIYQDYINHGWSAEKAAKAVSKSIESGSDIEDAKEALENNKEYFKKKYDEVIEEAKTAKEKKQAEDKKQAEELKSSIMEDTKFFGDDLTKADREKIYNALIKPVEKDPTTGQFLTAIQAYEKKNKINFLRNLGYCFAMTNGFKDFDNLSKRKVKKEVNKGLKALEDTLKSTQRDANGNIVFASGVSSEEYLGNFLDLDV